MEHVVASAVNRHSYFASLVSALVKCTDEEAQQEFTLWWHFLCITLAYFCAFLLNWLRTLVKLHVIGWPHVSMLHDTLQVLCKLHLVAEICSRSGYLAVAAVVTA